MVIIALLCVVNFLNAIQEVGTTAYHLVDISRLETHHQNPHRELVVQIWYPATASNTHPIASYLGKTSYIIKKNMSNGLGQPASNFDYLDELSSHSFLNAPISTKSNMYPLLIFSPGFGTPCQLYTSYFETLAHQNYIVVAISHTYNTNPTVFPDGRIIEQSELFKNNISSDQADILMLNELATWVADIRFVIDQIVMFNTSNGHFLSGKIDTHNIGILGHSFGGAAAMRACQFDNRIKACINMDGRLWENNHLNSTITVPLMTLLSDTEINPYAKETRRCAFQIMKQAQNDTYCFMINDSNHYSFSDDTILTNYQHCTVESKELVSFLPFFISSFFNTYLHHQENKIFGAIAQYQHLIKQYFIDIGTHL